MFDFLAWFLFWIGTDFATYFGTFFNPDGTPKVKLP